MKISVILPCYNGAKTIAVQLEALTRQVWQGEWEVIIANNGSTDSSIEIVEQFRDRLPQLTIVNAHDFSGPRLGAWHSYNVGLRAATGDAFVFCEADDEAGEGWLAAMAKALESHEFVIARMEYHRLNDSAMLGAPGTRLQETDIPKLKVPPYYNYAWGCSFGLRRSLCEKLGEISPQFNYAFDLEYCFRAQKIGLQLHFVPDAVMHYRLRQTPYEVFRQHRKWGEEFNQVTGCYGFARGKLPVLRRQLKVARLLLKGSVIWPLRRLGLPIKLKLASDLASDLGWTLGEISSLGKPLPVLPPLPVVASAPTAAHPVENQTA